MKVKYKYKIGDRWGSRIVIKSDEYPYITIKCDCGSEKLIFARLFKKNKQCGFCVRKTVQQLKHCKIGDKINKLTVLGINGYKYYSNTKQRMKFIKVQCDCGNVQDITLGQILIPDICIKCKS